MVQIRPTKAISDFASLIPSTLVDTSDPASFPPKQGLAHCLPVDRLVDRKVGSARISRKQTHSRARKDLHDHPPYRSKSKPNEQRRNPEPRETASTVARCCCRCTAMAVLGRSPEDR